MNPGNNASALPSAWGRCRVRSARWRQEVTEIPYVRQPLKFPARYAHGPDSFPQPGVPRGELHEYEWSASSVFRGTHRRYWVYVPAQYSDSKPASLMVFQDAEWYLDLEREDRASIVFDNLIYHGEMPVTQPWQQHDGGQVGDDSGAGADRKERDARDQGRMPERQLHVVRLEKED